MFIRTLPVGEYQANCYIVGCEKHQLGVIIDPGEEAEKILAEVEKIKMKIACIINTHAHFDHIGAVTELKQKTGAKFILHKKELTILNGEMNKDMLMFIGLTVPPQPDELLEKDQELKICEDFILRVLHTPGHTPGGICIVVDKYVFTGDTLFAESIGRTDFPGGAHSDIIKSIKEKIFTLGDDVIVMPGHGMETTVGHEKKNNPFVR